MVRRGGKCLCGHDRFQHDDSKNPVCLVAGCSCDLFEVKVFPDKGVVKFNKNVGFNDDVLGVVHR